MNPFDSRSSAPLLQETDNEPSVSSQTSPSNHAQLESSSSAYVSLGGIADSSAIPLGDKLVVKQSRWERVKHHAKNIFGAYVVCDVADDSTCCTHNPRCIVTDEVRMSAWVLLLILALIVLILAIIDISSGKVTVSGIADHKHYAAIAVAACFAFAATIITGHQVAAHRRHWTYPRAQIKIIRIIMMVPIYAWSAWFGLIFVELAVYIDFIRVCYEAFVIFNFLLLLTRYLGGQEGAIAILQREKNREMHWPTPCCWLPKFRFSSRFLYHIKRGTLQYVLISPLASFAAVLLGALGHYEDGVLDWTNGYVYIALIQNCTQMVALYCLVWFYLVAKDDLAPFNPLAKFIVVKSVVFFTFWQGVGINVLTKIGVIHDTGDFTAAQVQVGLQDFIICIEMFFAAAVHRWTFGHESFADGSFQETLDSIQASRKTEFAAEVLSAEVETPVVISDYKPPQASKYDPTASVMRRISPEEETDNENALI